MVSIGTFRRRGTALWVIALLLAQVEINVRAAEEPNLVEILRRRVQDLNDGTISTNYFPSAPAAGSESTTHRVVLVPGDVLKMDVPGDEILSAAELSVQPDGTIRHPVIGSVPLAGFTLDQARTRMFNILAEGYLVRPRLELELVRQGRHQLRIEGGVRRPGTYTLESNTALSLPTALQRAGGVPSPIASVNIKRTVGGIETNLMTTLDIATKSNLWVQAGDVITITTNAPSSLVPPE